MAVPSDVTNQGGMMINLLGISPGGSLSDRTTGVSRSGGAGFRAAQTYADRHSRRSALGYNGQYATIAIGAPILPHGVLHYEERSCEKVFGWMPFTKRCRSRRTDIELHGMVTRRAGCDTAIQWANETADGSRVAFPRMHSRASLVEAFPSGFMGVMLPDDAFDEESGAEPLFMRLHRQCTRRGIWADLQEVLDWSDGDLSAALATRTAQEELEAMICLFTAAAVWRGRYVAVGDAKTGFFFLPPWDLWQPWAKEALREHRASKRLPHELQVWIDGKRYRAGSPLPHDEHLRRPAPHAAPHSRRSGELVGHAP
jgi:hypothetical protein